MDLTVNVGNLTKKRLLQLREGIRAMKHDSGGRLSPLTIAREALTLPRQASRGDVLARLNEMLRAYGVVDVTTITAPDNGAVTADSEFASFMAKQLA